MSNTPLVVCPYDEILLGNEKDGIADAHINMGESQKHYSDKEEQNHILYDSIQLKVQKKQN